MSTKRTCHLSARACISQRRFVRLCAHCHRCCHDRLAPLRLFAEDCAAVAQRRARITICVQQLQLLAQFAPPQQQQQQQQQQHSNTKTCSTPTGIATTTAGGCVLYDLSVRGAQKRAYAALLCRTLAQQCSQSQVQHNLVTAHTLLTYRTNAFSEGAHKLCSNVTLLTVQDVWLAQY
jgi:hypothetical protein